MDRNTTVVDEDAHADSFGVNDKDGADVHGAVEDYVHDHVHVNGTGQRPLLDVRSAVTPTPPTQV